MGVAFFTIVLLHALIHLLGFIKGFGFKEVRELSLPISKPMGVAWLAAAIFLLAYAILFLDKVKYGWILGLFAVTCIPGADPPVLERCQVWHYSQCHHPRCLPGTNGAISIRSNGPRRDGADIERQASKILPKL
jgi:hypothetical protein